METLTSTKLYSYADYLTWQLEEYVELLRGKIVKMSPAPSRKHQKVSSRLHTRIGNFFEGKKCELYAAPFDVRFPKQTGQTEDAQIFTVLQPDLCVICDLSKLDRRGCLGAPDWVIEILSEGNTPKEMGEKYQIYEESGVQEYWIVQPDTQTILPYVLENGIFVGKAPMLGTETVGAYLFPDLKLDLSYVFEE